MTEFDWSYSYLSHMINSGFMIFCLQVRDFREINSPSCLCFYVFHAAFDLRSLFDYVNLFQSTMKQSLVLSAFCLLTTGKKQLQYINL